MSWSKWDFKQKKYIDMTEKKPTQKISKEEYKNLKPYCGSKKPTSKERKGTPTECYYLGRKAGFVGGISKSNIELSQKGLGSLRKDVLREIAFRFKVKNYSHMLKTELIDNILARKQNTKFFNLSELKNK
jgi:hypothetical protein